LLALNHDWENAVTMNLAFKAFDILVAALIFTTLG
jgi:hypothetical protein